MLTTRKKNWGEDRVMFFAEDGHLRSLLASWTDVDEPDAFARAAAGRACLRVDDLMRLRALLEAVQCRLGEGDGVKPDTPQA